MTSSPPVDAAAALGEAAARFGCFDVGRPDGPGWHPLRAATDPAWVGPLVAAVAEGGEHGPRPRAVAGAYVGGALAWSVLQPVAAVWATEGRALDVALDNAALLVDETGWVSRLALLEPRFAALPTDPAAGDPSVTTLEDEAALVAWAADRIVATFTPVFAAVRATSPYGTSGLWGALGDTISAVLWLLQEGGAGPAALDGAWRRCEALVDAVQARVPLLRARSRRLPLATPAGPVALPMRGTCCLYYRTPEAAVDGTDGLCSTCPRRPDDERVRLVEANLAAEA